MCQSIALARKPHVICATPGRLVDHLENTKVLTDGSYTIYNCHTNTNTNIKHQTSNNIRKSAHETSQAIYALSRYRCCYSTIGKIAVRHPLILPPPCLRVSTCAASSTWCWTRLTACSAWCEGVLSPCPETEHKRIKAG